MSVVPPGSEDPLFTTAMTLIDKLQKGKASKKVAIALIVSIVLDVALSVSLIFVAVAQHDVTSTIRQVNVQQCQVANVTRVQDKILWDTFFADVEPPGKKIPPKTIALVEGLRKIVDSKDAQRNCVKIYG